MPCMVYMHVLMMTWLWSPGHWHLFHGLEHEHIFVSQSGADVSCGHHQAVLPDVPSLSRLVALLGGRAEGRGAVS